MLQLPPFRYLSSNAALYAGAALASVAITSSTSINTLENTTAVGTLAATGGGTITWSLTGGADLAKFSIGSSSGALSFNVAPDFEAPADADLNNIYLVQVRATNGITSDTKTFSVTVTDVVEAPVFTTIVDPTLTVTETGWINYVIRTQIPTFLVSVAGTKLRFTMKAASTALQIGGMTVGRKGTGNVDFASAPATVTFSGAAGVTVAANGSVVSDVVSFSHDGVFPLVVAVHFTGNVWLANSSANMPGWQTYYRPGAGGSLTSLTADQTTAWSNHGLSIDKIESSP